MTTQDPFGVFRFWMEQRESQRREIETRVESTINWRIASDNGAVSLAKIAIQSGMLLNGGGMLAIPAAVTLFGIDVGASRFLLLATCSLFAAGLVSSWASSIAGFFALAIRADALFHREMATRWEFSAELCPEQERSALITNGAREHHFSAVKFRRFQRTRICAIGLCGASLLAFIVGAGLGGWCVARGPNRHVNSALIPGTPRQSMK